MKQWLLITLFLIATETCYVEYYTDRDGNVKSVLVCDFEDPEYA